MDINNLIIEDYCSPDIVNLLLKYGFNVDCPKPIPTHAIAIKWIRENFGIFIYIHHSVVSNFPAQCTFSIIGRRGFIYSETNVWSSPEKAIEAALLYTLKNLI